MPSRRVSFRSGDELQEVYEIESKIRCFSRALSSLLLDRKQQKEWLAEDLETALASTRAAGPCSAAIVGLQLRMDVMDLVDEALLRTVPLTNLSPPRPFTD